MKILTCDDDPVIRYLLEVVLGRRNGHDVIGVAHPDAVIPAILEHAPDLLLIDYVMPGRTGVEVVEALSANAATSDIPVVFLTGRVDVNVNQSLAGSQVAGLIEKPFDTSTLSDRLVEMVERARAH